MTENTDALVLDLVEWVAREPRPYADVLEVWPTAAPGLTRGAAGVDRGYVARRPSVEGMRVTVTATGETFLRAHGRMH